MIFRFFFCLILLLKLSSCGGGGGGGGSPTTSANNSSVTISQQWQVSQSEAAVYETSEYDPDFTSGVTTYSGYALGKINASSAYAVLNKNSKNVAGDNVKISIIDTGVQTNHVEISANFNSTSSYDFYSSDSDASDGDGHGTHVAAIAAGVKSGSGMHGVAFNAKIVAMKVFDDNGDNGTTNMVANAINASVTAGVKVINMSLGASSDPSNLVRSALLNAKSSDILSVAATGNDGASQPDYPAYYASDSALSGFVLAVGSVNSSSTISSFSNHCGVAKNYCLVAPGEEIGSAYSGSSSSYAIASGTSQATPFVSGAAAVLRSAWPHLTASQTAQILLQTATDLGDSGVDEIYGYGLLNLYKAVQYQGDDILGYSTSSTNLGNYKVSQSSIISSSIFGDALAVNASEILDKAIFLDSFGRDYKANLSSKILSQTRANLVDLNNYIFSNIASNVVPLSFGENNSSELKLSLSSFKNSQAQNIYGVKNLVIDKTQDPQNQLSQGFSFTQAIDKNNFSKIGFSWNYDNFSNLGAAEFTQNNFLNSNNFSSSHFASYLSSSNKSNTRRDFGQMFFSTKISENILSKFSYQSAFDQHLIGNNSTKKQNEIYDLSLIFKPKSNWKTMFSAGQFNEFDNNLLNSKTAGAFESLKNAKSSYLKLASSFNFNKWQFLANYSEGQTQVSGNDFGVFRDFTALRSRSFGTALVYNFNEMNSFGFSYSQPLRIYSGKTRIDVPTARDVDGNISRQSSWISLAPKGRQQDYEIFFSKRFNSDRKFNLNLVRQIEVANQKSAKPNNAIFASYSFFY